MCQILVNLTHCCKLRRREAAKATSKIGKICILYIYREYLLFPQSNVSGSLLQTCINFAEQRLKFSQFEGSMYLKFSIKF